MSEAIAEVEEDPGPEEVELLLYAERPSMTKRSAGVAVQSLIVVTDVKERTDGLSPENTGVIGKDEPQDDDDDPVDIKGRKDAQGAAHVKTFERDGA